MPFRESGARRRIQVIATMTLEELDELPYGAIKLDAEGVILGYNLAEAKLAGRDPKRVIGKNFFTEVAPCTNVEGFAGRYHEGVAAGELHDRFEFLFDFEMRPTTVEIVLHYEKAFGCGWVFVRALGYPTPAP